MLKRYLWPHASAMWLLGLLVFSLPLLAACGGAPAPAADAPAAAADTETAVEEEAETPVEQATATQEVAEAEEAEAVEDSEPQAEAAETTEEENRLADASTTLAECQTMDIPDNGLIAAVSEEDWVKGSANAPVTLIEYGDFQ